MCPDVSDEWSSGDAGGDSRCFRRFLSSESASDAGDSSSSAVVCYERFSEG